MEKLTRIQIDFWGAIITVLIAGNLYFIKRLVDQLDDTQKQVYLLREEVASIKEHVKNIGWKKL